jgi:hypothetical protein
VEINSDEMQSLKKEVGKSSNLLIAIRLENGLDYFLEVCVKRDVE